MIVLSRKKNESIIINDDIVVVVVEIRGDRVRLGIEHSKELPVHRNEVYEAMRGSVETEPVDLTPAQRRQRIRDLTREIREREGRS